MEQLERIGVSLEKKLLLNFDKLIAKQGYPSRSEAIRDLFRQHLSSERLSNPEAEAVAAVFLIYDHHLTKLMQELLGMQHSNLLHARSSGHSQLHGGNRA